MPNSLYCQFEESYKYIFLYAYTRVQQLQQVVPGSGVFFLVGAAVRTLRQLVALKVLFFLEVHKNFLQKHFGNGVTQILFRRHGSIPRSVQMRLMVEQLALGGVSSEYRLALSVSSYHIHSCITDFTCIYQSAESLSSTLKKLKLFMYLLHATGIWRIKPCAAY